MSNTETDLAWLGGIIDGEGHVGANWERPAKYKGYSRYLQIAINVTNTAFIIPERCKEITGQGGLYYHKNKDPNRKDWVKWEVRSNNALAVARLLLPYVISKSEQLQVLLEWGDLERFVGYHKKGSIAVTEEAMAARQSIYDRLAALNKRGR